MHTCVWANRPGTRWRHSMLPGRDVRCRHAFRYFQSARFLPFTVLLSATKSLSLSIHFSLLFLCKRRSSRFNSGSGPRTTSLRF
jgi:hypothetical protein